jgi:hypothetical protein
MQSVEQDVPAVVFIPCRDLNILVLHMCDAEYLTFFVQRSNVVFQQ